MDADVIFFYFLSTIRKKKLYLFIFLCQTFCENLKTHFFSWIFAIEFEKFQGIKKKKGPLCPRTRYCTSLSVCSDFEVVWPSITPSINSAR